MSGLLRNDQPLDRARERPFISRFGRALDPARRGCLVRLNLKKRRDFGERSQLVAAAQRVVERLQLELEHRVSIDGTPPPRSHAARRA